MHIIRLFAACGFLLLAVALNALGQNNFDCTNAVTLTNNTAYIENTTPAPGTGNPASICGDQAGHGVWFVITPPLNGRINITTCGSTYSTLLTVYTNICGSLSNLFDPFDNPVCSIGNGGSNPSGCGNAGVSFNGVAGLSYYILVGGYQSQSGTLQISASLPPAPANDSCQNPTLLTGGQTVVMSTTNATDFGKPNNLCGDGSSHGVWFEVIPSNNGRVNITTCGSSYSTLLTVYTNTCGSLSNLFDPFNNPVCSSGNGGSNPSSCGNAGVSFNGVAGMPYYILAAGYQYQCGTLQISASLPPAPANDSCQNPTLLTSGQTVVMSTTNATDFGKPNNLCGDGSSHGVWFEVIPSNNGRVNITTCGSSYSTLLTVYTNTCGSLSNLFDPFNNPVCSSGNGGSNPSSCGNAGVSFNGVAGMPYYILAAGYQYQCGTLQISASLPSVPANDSCQNPTLLTSGQTVVMSTTNATDFGKPNNLCGDGSSHGVWFEVIPSNNGRVNITTCGSSYNTLLTVYTNTCGSLSNLFDPFNNPVCSSGNGGSNPSSCGNAGVSFNGVAGMPYYILAAGYQYQCGTLQINANLPPAPANDSCQNPTLLTSGQTVVMSTTNATDFNKPNSVCGDESSHGVWFEVIPSNYGRVNITTCGSSYNTLLTVYTNTCGSLSNLFDPFNNPVCSSGNGGSNPSSCGYAGVSFNGVAGMPYYILAAGYQYQCGTLQINANLPPVPANDSCQNPTLLTDGQTVVMSTTNATDFGKPNNLCGDGSSHGVWFEVIPSNNGRVNITTCGSSYNTLLTVYTNTCESLSNLFDPFNNPVCSSGNGGSNPSSCGYAGVSFNGVAGMPYYILVSAYQYQTGTLRINASLPPVPANDSCQTAIMLTNGQTFTMSTTNATDLGKTNEICGTPISHGVWFSLQAYAGQPVTINTCDSSYSTLLAVYTNGCDSLGNPYTCSSSGNPFDCNQNNAGVSFVSPARMTCYILVGGLQYQAGALQIVANQSAPINDFCQYAIPMTNGIIYTATNIYATSIDDPVPSCAPGFERGVWYQYTPTNDGPVGISTCGSTFQTALAVYSGACGPPWTEIACSPNGGVYCDSGDASVNFYGVSGATYYILAGGVNGAAGTLHIQIPIVDLASTGLIATNSTGGQITAGRNLNASWTVQNQGSSPATGTWIDSLSLSNAVTNLVLWTFNSVHNAHAGGGYTNAQNGIPVPQIPVGHYSLIAMADSGNAVAEANKANNIEILPVTVTSLPPAITLLIPTNFVDRVSCVAVPFPLSAQIQPGSYTITNVIFYDGDPTYVIGNATNAPYHTTGIALGFGTNLIGAEALDNFGLTATSASLATVFIHYPTNLNVLRADLATNGDFVGCMCAYSGSNYVVDVTTNLASQMPWQPYITNRASGNAVAFTNHPALQPHFFRVRLR